MKSVRTQALVTLDGSSASVFLIRDGQTLGSSSLVSLDTKGKERGKGKVTEPKREFVPRMLATLRTAVTKALEDSRRGHHAVGSVDSVDIRYAAPWLHSELYDVSITEDEPKRYDRKAIVGAIEEARLKHAGALEAASKGLKLTCVAASTARLFENGYPMSVPVGGKLTEVRATTFAHYLSREDRKEVENAVRLVAPGATVTHGSLVASLAALVTTPGDGLSDATALSLSADVTELVVIVDDHVTAAISVPCGFRMVLDELERSLPVAGDSYGYLERRVHGELSERDADRMDRVLERAIETWAGKVGATVRAAGLMTLPPDVAIAPAPGCAAVYGLILGHRLTEAELFTGTKARIHAFPHHSLLTAAFPEVS